MLFFSRVLDQIGLKGTFLAGIFLIGMMGLTVVNVSLRFFGLVFAGTYELTELLNVVVIACALGFSVFKGGQVVVEILVSNLPSPVQKLIDTFMSLLAMGFWGIVAWSSLLFMLSRLSNEKTEMLKVPFLPFRLIWVCGLVFIVIVYFYKAVSTIRGRGKE